MSSSTRPIQELKERANIPPREQGVRINIREAASMEFPWPKAEERGCDVNFHGARPSAVSNLIRPVRGARRKELMQFQLAGGAQLSLGLRRGIEEEARRRFEAGNEDLGLEWPGKTLAGVNRIIWILDPVAATGGALHARCTFARDPGEPFQEKGCLPEWT
ncbi:hypothetical protein KM043_003581 [Ampulex compressa]|nr:hypothetical protein KM043_003581 [Ampulex compressa]